MSGGARAGDPDGIGAAAADAAAPAAAAPEWAAALACAPGGPGAASAAELAARAGASYREQTSIPQAVADLGVLAELGLATDGRRSPGRVATGVVPPYRLAVTSAAVAGGGSFRVRRYGSRGVELSRFLPVLESFGLVVVEAVPHQLHPGAAIPAAHIDDIGVRMPATRRGAVFEPAQDGDRLVAALGAVIDGAADLDGLNRLVLAAGLEWHDVALLRAYRRYRRQTGVPLSDAQLDDPLVAWPAVSRNLIAYAGARFGAGDGGGRDARAEAARSAVVEALAAVDHFEQDQVLRAYLGLVDATVRTNWLVREADGGPRPALVVKLDGARVPGLVPPRPKIETWVHGPEVEAVHLRHGIIARGGIRWSDRPGDFRTEVLDLAQAQVKKNAIIVPTGAKGGFVVRHPGLSRPGLVDPGLPGEEPPGGEPEGEPATPAPEQIEHAYRLFMDALFDVTDNVVDGVVAAARGVVAYDGEDPYLVVAADRGTATLSDVANEIAARRGFWLGDAFASGGSHGYDHKAMGITARGVWVAVRRHFHQLGIDVARETIRVAGVGDMSGDVFGNGMLQSEAMALVAAFDHRHIFVDPDPDPGRSFAERRRLAALGRSSWDDYDRSVLSAGGGIWPRDAKVVELSPDARRALGVADAELSPPQVVSAILRAPVDLLFFGGIGTYVKGPGEADAEVGDHANDPVRVTADEVRARVIAEGGNLAVTQAGRVRYSRRGGRVNADFIDNAAGVATSDREVNLKIFLSLAEAAGRARPEQRDAFLAGAEPEVARSVLGQVAHSVAALNRALPASADELDAHEALLDLLEGQGTLDRQVEDLPGTAELEVRRGVGAGLIRPELAVLLAYTKSDLASAIEPSPLVSDGSLSALVVDYFPPSFRALGEDLAARHRLASQLAATALASELVDQMGITWTHETAAEMGRSLVEVAAAFWASRQALDARELWEAIEVVAEDLAADDGARAHRRVVAAVGALARRYLALGACGSPLEPVGPEGGTAAGLRPGLGEGTDVSAEPAVPALPADLERRLRVLDGATYLADAPAIARSTSTPLAVVIETFARLDEAVAPGLIRRLQELRPRSRWSAWHARALVDDLVAWRPRAVTAVLAATVTPAGAETVGAEEAGLDPPAAVRSWVEEHRHALARVAELARSLDPDGVDALSVAALLVRTLAVTA